MDPNIVICTDEIKYLPCSRVLSHLEIQLFSYLGAERHAVTMAPYAVLAEDASYEEIETEVTRIIATMLEKKQGKTEIEYMGGQRRDTLRGKY